MGYMDDLQKLYKLKRAGAVSDAEFQKAKDILLRRSKSPGGRIGNKISDGVKQISSDEKKWSTLIHYSQLGVFFFHVFGAVAPLVLWQMKKDESPMIYKHGIVVAILVISVSIYYVALKVFRATEIIPLLLPLWAGFSILGGIKANAGKVWPYPLSIPFFSTD